MTIASFQDFWNIDNQILEVIRAPVRFIPIVMGIFFATSALNVGEDVEAFFNHINRSLVTFTLFWTLHRIVSPIGGILMHSRGILTPAMVDWIIKSAKVAFILLGSAAILEIWGIAVAPIIAGLGLFGVAVALGAQDLFKNLMWRKSAFARPKSAVSTRPPFMCPIPNYRIMRSPISRE
jgi:MscS family membrane protein